ncbi:retron Ec67 family RNA-directed DNA polymerase/endonuclease [Synechococcus sp. CS-1327]|uniref:retron Ec67 family RNA-directed DNA polymerase/endonuclease n=1 Tax=Synechococcus sp. CS-1327 TaxID=2847977 RepID=UPI00223A6B5B|nr:retron Ec67 family RNA-directed DNA polymerase/endonuclease [Synechococcus sp. CS-1327]
MSLLRSLQEAKDSNDLALILGFKPKSLTYIVYGMPEASKYKIFEIPKRSGGFRTISSPVDSLKLLQRRLADVLQDCKEEIDILRCKASKKTSPSTISHGFSRGRSVRSNAKPHRNKQFVFNVDLQDFFSSINFGRVRGFFSVDKSFQLDIKVSTVIAQIACNMNCLPQGSPCSPVISNLIAHIMDIHLVSLASKLGCTYTRYADDLTFSTNKLKFPKSLGISSENDIHEWIAGPELLRIINHSGFRINKNKTRMQYRFSRQEVTGLIVNKRLNVPFEYRHTVRAMAHSLFTKGKFLVPCFAKDQLGDIQSAITNGTLPQLQGRLGYIHSVDQLYYKSRLENLTSDKEKEIVIAARDKSETIYRKFLYFKEFYASTRPLLICEGATDPIYIKSALKHLPKHNFKALFENDIDDDLRLSFKFLNFSDSSTGRILKIQGGTGKLASFVSTYQREIENFRSVPGMKYPVILLLDNDSGADNVMQAAKQVLRLKTNINRNALFTHVCLNLYLVFVPSVGNLKASSIEDLFDSETKAIKVRGKSFSSLSKVDPEIYYGKKIFAKEVIEAQAKSVDFNGFEPLLKRIASAIDAHAQQRIY